MIQRTEVRDKEEDWTGKNSTALRRKLQNRLNKRASRNPPPPPSSGQSRDTNHPLPSLGRRKNEALHAAALTAYPEPEPEPNLDPPTSEQIQHLPCIRLPTTTHFEIAKRPYGHLPNICLHSSLRQRVTSASSFASFLSFPLPVDQKLLTLLHFNLVRALTKNILILGLDPERMNEDLDSPWTVVGEGEGLRSEEVPEGMRPTRLQRRVRHHPEADIFPFPEYRDNMILAGEEIDDMELCMDVLYGIDPREMEREHGMVGESGRTGLIVWSDPWMPSSWEVEEGFARKWISRGERPLILQS
ncbi:hypothetical protein EG329_013639 [Mollisiaceae sp. DMI_Dod_QoI]|nr:hypothetical protein EG329_013639 [Helotiales sp. DMI_Dod_QoI]